MLPAGPDVAMWPDVTMCVTISVENLLHYLALFVRYP
jgi:hypothetical protein